MVLGMYTSADVSTRFYGSQPGQERAFQLSAVCVVRHNPTDAVAHILWSSSSSNEPSWLWATVC